jgi:hypothetical protein
MRIWKVSSIALVFGLLIASPAVAQVSPGAEDGGVLSSAAMDAALAGHESAVDQQRAQLAELLSQPRVQELATARGMDISRVGAAAAGLSDEQVKEVSPLVAKVVPMMQQNMGTVTISVAALIIILLILILVS